MKSRAVTDRLGIAMRASHVLVLLFVVGGIVFAAVGTAMGDTFFLRPATEALIFASLALSVDILLGYTGLLSLGQALYFGLGAYVSAVVLRQVPSFWAAMAAVLLIFLIVGFAVGLTANRVRGVYFALVTFGLAQVVAKAIYNTRAVGASDGLIGVPIIPIDLGVAVVMSNAPAVSSWSRWALSSCSMRSAPICLIRRSDGFWSRCGPTSAGSRSWVIRPAARGSPLMSSPPRRGIIRRALSDAARLRIARARVLFDIRQCRHHRGHRRGRNARGRAVRWRDPYRSQIGGWLDDAAPPHSDRPFVYGHGDFSAERRARVREAADRTIANRAGAMTPVLEVILGVAFGGIRAVDGVSFAAEQNAITTIIGPNGAGKSTLFNLINGLIRPNSGRVILGGVDRTGSPPHLMQRAGLGRSFQITYLFFELTVFENLRLAAQRLEPTSRSLLPMGKSDRALARVGNLIDRFRLQAKVGELAGALSHGEQRRLEIAVALAAKPSILLLDEPTQGVTPIRNREPDP